MFHGPRKVELVGAACIMIVGTVCVANLIANHTHTHGTPEYENKANQGAELLGTQLPKQATQQILYQVERSSTDIVPLTTFEVLAQDANKLKCDTVPTPACKTTGEKGDCKFPFKHKGKWYYTCTDKGHSHLWCKTANGWGDCQSQARCTTAPPIPDQKTVDGVVLEAMGRGFCETTLNDDCTIAEIKQWAVAEGKTHEKDELRKIAKKIVSGFASCSEAEELQQALKRANKRYGGK